MKKVTRRDFNAFLMTKGVFKRFYINKKTLYWEAADWSKESNCRPAFWVIACGFYWNQSPEGYEYWQSISHQWEQYLVEWTNEEVV